MGSVVAHAQYGSTVCRQRSRASNDRGGTLLLGVTHTVAETPSADLVLVPGGMTTPSQMVDDEVLDWLRKVHETATWTASVCTGALILGAAGILNGLPATTHWYKMGVLKIMRAIPQPGARILRELLSCAARDR